MARLFDVAQRHVSGDRFVVDTVFGFVETTNGGNYEMFWVLGDGTSSPAIPYIPQINGAAAAMDLDLVAKDVNGESAYFKAQVLYNAGTLAIVGAQNNLLALKSTGAALWTATFVDGIELLVSTNSGGGPAYATTWRARITVFNVERAP